ncbi:hypothetical protein HDV01_007528 [Terramyces sp. JEL0728]|nr:hypothetical protein HDV01_007528 [Terramyces sp. JEL0728]
MLSLLVSTALCAPFGFDNHQTSNPIVTISQGQFKGTSDSQVSAWLNIPYAQPPVGELRFKHPVPLGSSSQLFDATNFGNSCIPRIQNSTFFSKLISGTPSPVAEDCLNLNVYAPNNAKNLPVMVFVFPGGFDSGDDHQGAIYDGRNILKHFPNAVIVAMNYRIGPFGFLASTDLENEGSLNSGLYDVKLVFEWVKQNIAAFGGNPSQITAFGESSGSITVSSLLVADNGNQTLFDRAILMSGPNGYAFDKPSSPRKEGVYTKLANAVGCTGQPNLLECLRNATPDQIIKYSTQLESTDMEFGYGLTFDGYLPRNTVDAYQKGLFSKIPVVITTVEAEGSLMNGPLVAFPVTNSQQYENLLTEKLGEFGTPAIIKQMLQIYDPKKYSNYVEAFGDFIGDFWFKCPASLMAQVWSNNTLPVYVGRNRHVPVLSYIAGNTKAFHTSDLILAWETRSLMFPTEYSLSDFVAGYFVNFANGNPPTNNWPLYQSSQRIDIESQKVEVDADQLKPACKIYYNNAGFVTRSDQ